MEILKDSLAESEVVRKLVSKKLVIVACKRNNLKNALDANEEIKVKQ